MLNFLFTYNNASRKKLTIYSDEMKKKSSFFLKIALIDKTSLTIVYFNLTEILYAAHSFPGNSSESSLVHNQPESCSKCLISRYQCRLLFIYLFIYLRPLVFLSVSLMTKSSVASEHEPCLRGLPWEKCLRLLAGHFPISG